MVQSNMNSKANGALMRITPLAVWGHQLSEEQLVQAAREDAQLTHPNQTCQVGIRKQHRQLLVHFLKSFKLESVQTQSMCILTSTALCRHPVQTMRLPPMLEWFTKGVLNAKLFCIAAVDWLVQEMHRLTLLFFQE